MNPAAAIVFTLTSPQLLRRAPEARRSPPTTSALPEVISKEPLGPRWVRHGDDQWFDVVKWTLFAMVGAEELGVTQKNVDEMAKSDKPSSYSARVRHRRQSRRTARLDQGLGRRGS